MNSGITIGVVKKAKSCNGFTGQFELDGTTYHFVNGCLVSADNNGQPPFIFDKNFGIISNEVIEQSLIQFIYQDSNNAVNFVISDFETNEINYNGSTVNVITANISCDLSNTNVLVLSGFFTAIEILGLGAIENCNSLQLNNMNLEKFNPIFPIPTTVDFINLQGNQAGIFEQPFLPDEFADNIHIVSNGQIFLQGGTFVTPYATSILNDKGWNVTYGGR